MAGGFKILEHTADVLLEAYGDTLEEAFEYAALAMFEVMTDLSSVRPLEKREVEVEGIDLYSLLYNWLEELLFLFDTEALLVSKAKVHEISKVDDAYRLRAEVWGEPYDPERHVSKVLVKAATYHMMEIKRRDGGYTLRFVVDI